MNTLKTILLVAVVALAGCRYPPKDATPPIQPLPYHYHLELTSQIPDPYYVLAGPGQSYRRFPFNAWAGQALERQLKLRSGASQPTITVKLNLLSLATGYNEIGLGPSLPTLRYAGVGGGPWFSDRDFEDDGPAIPSEIHKSVTLKASLTLARGERILSRENLEVQSKEVILRENFDAWSYDYGDLLKQAIRQLVEKVDDVLVKNSD
jgi:hypothetical protein